MTPDEILDSSAWWAALRLDERLRTPVPGDETTRERGRDRLRSWREDKHLTGGLEPELDRWRETGIDDDTLTGLLGETPESLRARLPERPGWLTVLDVAYHATHLPEPHHDPGLLTLVYPLCVHFEKELRALLPGDPLPAGHPLLRFDVDTLRITITPTLVREMHAANARGALAGDTSEERFAAFVRSLREPANALTVLQRYPVLARELVEQLSGWLRVRSGLAARLIADLPELRATYGVEASNLNDIKEIAYGAGDTHRGGQSVAILTFACGRKVVYKPRSIAVERHFHELVGWLNARGLTHPLRTLQIIDRPEYGWAEFVAEEPCTTQEAVGRFFWRQGGFLALLYALRTHDVHIENLIAAGEHPVFIDLEASLQPPLPTTETNFGALPQVAVRMLDESVLGVGLLPQRIIQQDGPVSRSVDMSGLTGGADVTPTPVPHWVDVGTDEMRLAREHLPMSRGQNLATLGEQPVDASGFRAEVCAGFTQMYRVLIQHKDELLAEGGPMTAFAADEVRPVLRATMTYGRLLLESWHPDALTDALDRACLFELLAKGHKQTPQRWQVVGSEIRQILAGDVPCFGVRVDSRDLRDDQGVVVPDFYPEPGADWIDRHVRGLSEEDLKLQLWCIEASMNAAQIGEVAREHDAAPRPLAGPIDLDLAMRAASLLGDRLLDTALREAETNRPVWLALNLVGERYWNVAPTAFESFTGINGIALFLAQLGDLTGDARYRRDARAIAGILTEQIDVWLALADEPRAALGFGGFTELGSSVYALAQLGALWGADELYEAALRLVPEISSRFAQDQTLDVVGGTAGAALALLALHAVHPDERIENALLAAGDTLIAAADPYPSGVAWTTTIGSRRPLLGYSHGASGMAVALARIAAVTGQSRFADTAAAALRYEHAQFDVAAGNWPDERDINPPGTFMNAWCHGAGGVGLARAEMLGSVADPSVATDLDAAIATIRRDLFDGDLFDGGRLVGTANDSICHGDLGLADTLLTAGLALGNTTLVAEASRVAGTVAESVLDGKERCGVPKGMHTPGLMMGIAGIGYGLLRIAAPDRVPSVLALGAPIAGGTAE